MKNYIKLELAALGENESFARSAVAAFALSLNPTLSELSDIKTAVSEAVTNCIVHAYRHSAQDKIVIECTIEKDALGGVLHVDVTDFGVGIENVEEALSPFFTTLSKEERSGMGFTIMQAFMDKLSVHSGAGKGTRVHMEKRIGFDSKKEYPTAFERESVNA